MANNLNATPVRVDTDLASFLAAQTLRSGQNFSQRVYKITLVVGSSASTAGTVAITDPITGNALIAPLVVAGGTAANTTIYDDSLESMLTWADFKVAGVTATGTILYVWYKA